ncbi:MAG: hypothetical protein FWF23_01930 [Alphaproteobacteria bacterium]|nr:hypothetical protein [Alphaproteobacteria bacterium]MCL2505667.1 hypothetical protein [Alphaproteobacteria bacterium]
MNKYISLIGFLLALYPMQAAAAGKACYSNEHVKAEHMLRLHSELLVITLTCKNASDGTDLPEAYTTFTKKNLDALKKAEQTMMSYYKSVSQNPTSSLDTLRTKLGNEFGKKAAELSSDAFCYHYRDKVVILRNASKNQVAQHAADFENAGQKTLVSPCDRVAAK